jgi:protein-tyrosine phosphatase
MRIQLVISMTRREPYPEFCSQPLKWVHAPSIDSPLTPIPMERFRTGVEAAIPVLAAGGGVLCHCREGRHRAVAMACCILIAQGCSAESAMRLVEAGRSVARPRAFWIAPRIHRFERLWLGGLRDELDPPASVAEEACRLG